MKYVRIPFNSLALREPNFKFGINEFKQILDKLPVDSKIIGFGQTHDYLCSYIFVSSDSFNDVPDGTFPPDATVRFHRKPDGTTTCDGINYGNASVQCVHDFAKYVGMYDTFDYCKKCNEKQASK